MTATKDTALNRNAASAPAAATIRPPIAGPIERAMLNPTLLMAIAAASSSRGTSSLTEACQAGP
jgi:hypothetical protein